MSTCKYKRNILMNPQIKQLESLIVLRPLIMVTHQVECSCVHTGSTLYFVISATVSSYLVLRIGLSNRTEFGGRNCVSNCLIECVVSGERSRSRCTAVCVVLCCVVCAVGMGRQKKKHKFCIHICQYLYCCCEAVDCCAKCVAACVPGRKMARMARR